jgi:hypothetical protein
VLVAFTAAALKTLFWPEASDANLLLFTNFSDIRLNGLWVSAVFFTVVILERHHQARVRQAAFDACAFLIDFLKTRAPFWKLEATDGGERWVEARASDLAQVRPEYGHATNAVCIVGRRWRSRGLFLDRRAFLVSYDPDRDVDGAILARTLAAVGPVAAGINLAYTLSRDKPRDGRFRADK